MTRNLLLILAFVTVAVCTTFSAWAQEPAPAGGKPVCPLPPCRTVAPRGINLADAKKMVAATAAAATKADWNVAIAVVDANGDLVYFERMDGAHDRAVTSALGKARAAVMFGVPGRVVQDAIVAGQPVTVTITAPQAWPWEILPQAGGLPILKNGKVVAGIGVGGARPTPAEAAAGKNADEEFAKVGIAAISPIK